MKKLVELIVVFFFVRSFCLCRGSFSIETILISHDSEIAPARDGPSDLIRLWTKWMPIGRAIKKMLSFSTNYIFVVKLPGKVCERQRKSHFFLLSLYAFFFFVFLRECDEVTYIRIFTKQKEEEDENETRILNLLTYFPNARDDTVRRRVCVHNPSPAYRSSLRMLWMYPLRCQRNRFK